MACGGFVRAGGRESPPRAPRRRSAGETQKRTAHRGVRGVLRKPLEVRYLFRGPGRPSLMRGSPGGGWRSSGGSADWIDEPPRVIEGIG